MEIKKHWWLVIAFFGWKYSWFIVYSFSLMSNIEVIFEFTSQSRISKTGCFFSLKKKNIFWFKSSFSVFSLVNIYQISFKGTYIVFKTYYINQTSLNISFDLVLPWHWLYFVYWQLQRKVDRSFKNSNWETLRN